MSSVETKELDLVGKVELRIALTETDAKLQAILKIYLAPLLLKLASEHLSVRNKVISVCHHVNTRIKSPSIELPVGALLKQYKETSNNLVRHFDLLYIQQGIERISIADQISQIPIILRGLATNYSESVANTASLFNLFLRLLHNLPLPSRGSNEDQKLRAELGFSDNPKDAEFVAKWIGKLILYTPTSSTSTQSPGLSKSECDFLQLYGKEDTWRSGTSGSLSLVDTKVVAARFLASGAFTDSERFVPALEISADANSRLSEIGDDILKRAIQAVSMEDEALIVTLLELYLGKQQPEPVTAVRLPLRIKILVQLCRSKKVTQRAEEIIQIVNDGLLPQTPTTSASSRVVSHGLEASKLRKQVFSFVNWVARIGAPHDLNAIAPPIVAKIREYIESRGWPKVESEEQGSRPLEAESRAYGYESIGLLAAACPERLLLDPNLDLLRWLFRSLSEDTSGKDIAISIEGALASVLGPFANNQRVDLEAPLEELLLFNMSIDIGSSERGEIVVRSTRYAAVRFANRCLPFANVRARRINLLAIDRGTQERNEVVEEGKKGLDPYWYKNLNPIAGSLSSLAPESHEKYQLPKFMNLVQEILGDHKARLSSALPSAILFCRCILLHDALKEHGKAPQMDTDWKRNLDALAFNNEENRVQLKIHLSSQFGSIPESSNPLNILLSSAFSGFSVENQAGIDDIADSLLDLSTVSPPRILDNLARRTAELEMMLYSSQRPSRTTAAHLWGLLAVRSSCPSLAKAKLIDGYWDRAALWTKAIGSEVHRVHGSILALAYFLARAEYSNEAKSTEIEAANDRLRQLALAILGSSRDKELIDAAIIVIDQLSLFGVLTISSFSETQDATGMLDKLTGEAKKGNEKAVSALGHFAMQCPEVDEEGSLLAKVFTILYDQHNIRQAEVQFSVGASLTCASAGFHSTSLIGVFDLDGEPHPIGARKNCVTQVITKIFEDCKTTKPALRQACVIWLLCFVQYCGHLPEVVEMLPTFQLAFKSFLSDRDSLNQESAARGLTLVYEKGDRSLKDDLVRDLVGTFTGSTANLAGRVSDETQLFEPGALPTGDGSVTTYKDIMSLASEVGDSSLVYKFMSLASNNAIWSSRAAFGRFGLSNILSDSSVDGYLSKNPKLYPALYRYRFDPNTNVRNAMNDIWNALVKDTSATIELYFDVILKDLLKNVLGKEWRTRQSCCAAIADLVQGRPLQKYEGYLAEIWTLTFKVCDDVKETVRTAAMALARVLTGIVTRSLEGGTASSTNARKMLDQVLPFLLSPSGLESSAQEVQGFALSTLLQIIKSSKPEVLRPYVPDLAGRLIALLSSLEPQAVNYIHLNADKYNMTTQQIDDIRLSSVRASPMMEAIERCIDTLDEDTMQKLCDTFENVVKSAVGLPSKVGAARSAVSLATRRTFLFRPHADSFLRMLRRQVLDRNETISASFAVACGYVARSATDKEILKLVDYCKKLYFDSDDDRHRAVSGDILDAVAKNAADRFASLAVDILPFVFVAKHDTNEHARDLFSDTWNESVGGSRAVSLYLSEICAMILPNLDSNRWSVKHTSASAIADVVTVVGKEISREQVQVIWPALEKALSGKTWEGKEAVLEAMITLAKNSDITETLPPVAQKMQTIIFRESKRTNQRYRPYAFACLGDFVDLQKHTDLYNEVCDIAIPPLEELLDSGDSMDVDSKTGGPSSKSTSEVNLANASRALLQSIYSENLAREELGKRLQRTLPLITKVIKRKDRGTTATIIEAEKGFAQKLTSQDMDSDIVEDILASEVVPYLFEQDNRTEDTRIAAANIAGALARNCRRGGKLHGLLRTELAQASQRERALAAQQNLDKAVQALR
ncbi:proteasome component M29 [Agyrium rufum]|nr:proteasome component M29 [Agyrium rufum]